MHYFGIPLHAQAIFIAYKILYLGFADAVNMPY